MNHWLFKSEPSSFSFQMLKAKGKAGQEWDGVRNYAARNNMRAMAVGDLGFFYHSNEGLDIVGIVEVCALGPPRLRPPTTRAGNASISAPCGTCRIRRRWTRSRQSPKLAEMALVRLGRLSVQPVTPAEWREVCRMGGLDPAP